MPEICRKVPPVSLALVDPLGSVDRPESGPRTPPPRWQVWRSPGDQPRWARPALLAIVAVAALLYAWNLSTVDLSPYYAVAVKSMSESWKAFFYGAFDPQATITIDKLAGSFLPQALSARLFGFSGWAVALPQVIEGVVTVLVMYRVVRRWAGAAPAILAAGIFAITPIAASMFGHGMEDGCLTMCLVLAADAYQRAVLDARLRSLLLAGVWIGLGFQCKMLQAWMILPALAVGYAVTAPAPLRRRLWHLGVAGAVTLAVSLSWVLVFTFTPAADRPYVDGSTNNSAAAMVFGYNGLERFGITLPGAVTGKGPGAERPSRGPDATAGPGAVGPGAVGPPDAAPAGGPGGLSPDAAGGKWAKLVSSQYAPEIGWLFPLALVALVLGLWWRRPVDRTDPVRGGLIMWGTWLLTFGVIYSDMSSLPHTAYVASLAPPIAALGGAGIVMLVRAYRAGGRRAWALPATVAAELVWTVWVWLPYRDFLPWALWLSAGTGVLALGALVAARLTSRSRVRLVATGVVAAVVAMLAAPATWAASVLDTRYEGSSYDAGAGPAGSLGGLGRQMPAARAKRPGAAPASRASLLAADTTLSASERRIYDYTQAHRRGAAYLMAATSWVTAQPYILATGQEVLLIGGFSGQVPEPVLGRVQELVHSGQLRFFLLTAGGMLPGGPVPGAVSAWVEHTCGRVDPAGYGGAIAPSFDGGISTLYQCGHG
jgi:4-amino-4-deoxy-L-arabinose transferase-like glycosyltransferase